MQPIRILLAEDHHLVRAGIRALIQGLPNTEVIAEASDGEEAQRLIAEHEPDIAFLDIAMPLCNGLDVAAYVTDCHPNVRVIILSMHANEEYVLKALQAGAQGYLMKDADIGELERAITAVMDNKSYLSPSVSQHVADYIRRINHSTSQPIPTSPIDNLTNRQQQILKLIAEGFTTKQIADQLNISVKTAEAHRANIMKRLDIFDIAGLVRFAIRVGLVSE